jgi:hypothetical protein
MSDKLRPVAVCVALLATIALHATSALASQSVAGKSLGIKDDATRRASRSLKVSFSDPAIALPVPASANDPTASGAAGGGARLSVSNPVTGEAAVYSLPASGWTGSGTSPGATGYKYKDAKLANGPCKSASIKEGSLRASCRGARVGFSLDDPATPSLVIAFKVASEPALCAEFGSATVSKYAPALTGKGQLKANDAPAPLSCTVPGLADVGTLVILGDSLSTGTAGECAGGACARYYELLHSALETEYGHSVALVHAAVGAGHVSDVLDQVDGLPAVLTGPVAVAVTAGGNNLLNATMDPGFPASLPALAVAMGEEIDDVLAALLAPDRFGSGVVAEVFWADFYDASDGNADTPGIGGIPITSQNVLDYTAEIDRHVTAGGEHLVDLYGPFFGHGECGAVPPPATGSWLYSDCIHQTAIGEGVLADQFRLEIVGTHD